MTAFRWGLVAGAVPILVVGAGVYLSIEPYFYALPFKVELLSNGADIDRAGGVKVIVTNGQGPVMTQLCRDGCDDLQFQAQPSDNAVGVAVLDRARRPLTPPLTPLYVTTGMLTRFVVADDAGLKVRMSYIDEHRNGEVHEMKLDEPARPTTAPPNSTP